MSPPEDRTSLKPKQVPQEIYDPKAAQSKQQFFSFRWLLRKSKSAKFSKEVAPGNPVVVPSSKSCDAMGLSEKTPSVPTFLLWKLLPPAGKGVKPQSGNAARSLPFRSSFSCSDVHHMSVTSQLLSSAASARDVSGDTEKPVLCRLCLGSVGRERMLALEECGCMFCIVCLHQYLVINIKDGNIPITCPDANCPHSGNILLSEIKEIAGEDALVMFERYKLNLDVDLDPSRVWCPSPGCETICTVAQQSTDHDGVLVHCLTCRLKFCSECKLRWHGNMSCEEARKSLADEIELNEEESWIKRCPNCRIPIEKDEGCAQMMCYRCKHVFCWHCLTSLDDDFLLRHYDKGPCRNMLGHSRASMIWHRTQVVGIFAGFSFLLLVASPFLLLAAPCLLCCRCRNGRMLYEEATPL